MRIIVILFIGFLSLGIVAQNDTSNQTDTNLWQEFTYDMESIFGGMAYAYSRPIHWKGEQWKTFGYVIAGTGLVYFTDKPTSDFFRGIREDVPSFIRSYGTEYGSPQNNYFITGAVYMTGLFTKNEKLRRTGVLLISSASAAGLMQQILKSAVGRARPSSGETKNTFDPFWSGNKDFHSFPSGHHILAFTNAYAIAKQFKNPWVKTGIYVLGLVPGISRLWDGKHWLSDIAFSTALSIFTVESIDRYLDRRYDKKYNNETAKNWDWHLSMGPNTVSVLINF